VHYRAAFIFIFMAWPLRTSPPSSTGGMTC